MKKNGVSVVWLAVVLFCGWLAGCGVKGPPIPLNPTILPKVVSLAYTLSDESVTLKWLTSDRLTGKAARESRFVVFQSRTALNEKECATCPLVFNRVGVLPYFEQQGEGFVFRTGLDPGYRYAYKIQIERRNTAGPTSNLVQFDLP